MALLMLWWLAPLTTGDALARVDGLSRWLQAAMTTVLGFYFGHLGTRRAESRATIAEAEVERTLAPATELETAVAEVDARSEKLDRLLARLRQDGSLSAKIDEVLGEVE